MKCLFCDANIIGEPVYENCKTNIELIDEIFKENRYCSRICAIAADFIFIMDAELTINENLQADDYNDDAHKEAFYRIVEDVMDECACTEEEMIEAFSKIEVVVG
jgi:hypothetical protein